MTVNKYIIEMYRDEGLNLTLLNGKIPILKDWNLKKINDDAIYSHKGNLGWVIDENHLVIDVDPKNNGFESFERLKMALGVELIPTTITPSGGYHIYTTLPAYWIGIKLLKNLNQYKGIDFLSVGTQCVIAGSVTEKGTYYFYDDFCETITFIETPLTILNLIKDIRIGADRNDTDELSFLNKIDNTSTDEVIKMLQTLDPNCDYDTWIKIGMACHTWHKGRGFDLWDSWSQGGFSYDADMCNKKWIDFNKNNRGEITLGTLSHLVKETKCDNDDVRLNYHLNAISTVNTYKDIELIIAPNIKKENFNDITLEVLIKTLQLKIKEVLGVSVPISKVRNLVGKNKSNVVHGTFIDANGDVPQWCNDWVYISSTNSFFNLKSYKLKSTSAFNLICGVNVPYKEDSETKPYAVKYVSDNGFIQEVDGSVYMPCNDDLFINIDNSKFLNVFDKNSIPLESECYSNEGLTAINMIIKHVNFICNNNKENADMLMQWLAHQVQYTGKKILWSPIIQGIQGIGKTVFSEILKCCLGDVNVGIVSPTQVISDFNSWATDKCVNVLEELRIAGKSRYDCVNALKPLITDRMIQINSKGVKQYNTYNTTNYICFTNYKDAIPIDDDDRRWFVIFSEVNHISEIKEKLGVEPNDYFKLLFDNLKKYAGEVRKYFLEFKISDAFMQVKTAPMTTYKEAMVNSQNSKYEALEELKELIIKGGEFYNDKVLCPADLFLALSLEYEINITGTKEKNFLLSKLGYLNLGKPFYIKGKSRRVWAKQPMTNRQIHDAFKLKIETLNLETDS